MSLAHTPRARGLKREAETPPPENTSRPGAVAGLPTAQRPLGRRLPVGFHVLSAAQRGLKCLLAVGTHVGTEVVVGAHVPPQAPAGGESPITDQTLERLEAGVRSDVCLEHSRGDEASSTLRTFERLLACVRPAKNECFNAGAASGCYHLPTQSARSCGAAIATA